MTVNDMTNPKMPLEEPQDKKAHDAHQDDATSSPSKPGIVERASDILREAFGKNKKSEITPFTSEHIEHASESSESTTPAAELSSHPDVSDHSQSQAQSPPESGNERKLSTPPTAIYIPSPAGHRTDNTIQSGAPLTGRPHSKKPGQETEQGSVMVESANGIGWEAVKVSPMGEESDPFSLVPLGALGLGGGEKGLQVKEFGGKPESNQPRMPPSRTHLGPNYTESGQSGSEDEGTRGRLARDVRESAPEPVDPQSEGSTNTHAKPMPQTLPSFDNKPYSPPTENQNQLEISPRSSPKKQETITLPIYPMPASPSRSISAPNVSSRAPLPLPLSSRVAPGQRDVPRVFPSKGSVVAEPAWSREGSPELGSELEPVPASPPPASPPPASPTPLSQSKALPVCPSSPAYRPGEKRDDVEPRLCEPRGEGPESLAFGMLRVRSPDPEAGAGAETLASPTSPLSPSIITPPTTTTTTEFGAGAGTGKAPPLPATVVATLQQQQLAVEGEEEGAATLKKLTPIHPEKEE
ncbi:hypothetical protein IAR50_003112 [Cryptococcus sp. DSM 104548]